MKFISFLERQLKQIGQGGWAELFRKSQLGFNFLLRLPLYLFAIPAVLVIRLIKPLLLIRVGGLRAERIGHLAANTELSLCELDAGIHKPAQRHLDLYFFQGQSISNQQLARMWKRVLHIWPGWIVGTLSQINRLIPGGALHAHSCFSHDGRDIHNLLDRLPPHLSFIPEEVSRGEAGLRAMGIPAGALYVCLNVRDSAYLAEHMKGVDWSYHNYRDSDIQNYVLAAEALAERGYFVIRTGAKVHAAIKSTHPKVIDYATNGMRSDFMDIYLGATCAFCITTGTGLDNIPYVFRRPMVYVNFLPLGTLAGFSKLIITITRHHVSEKSNQELTLGEIFTHGVGFSLCASEYREKGVRLLENTPEEIRDVAIEMAERLDGSWQPDEHDDFLQQRFWELFPVDAKKPDGRAWQGKITGRFGASFLRNNQEWLQ